MQTKGHENGVKPSLCTYLRGRRENLEPLPTYKNAPRQRRVHSDM